ncbi:MAG: hypothetical protein KJ574_01085, partial [Nanoarchaeota archaeon]|nr:hypothetical protein [Nanoarchaeota archaeon]
MEKLTGMKVPDIDSVMAGLKAQEELMKKGVEEHPMNAELQYIKGWAERLTHDEQHYTFLLDYLLILGNLQKDRLLFVEKFRDSGFINNVIRIVAKHMKGELPNREEIYSLNEMMHRLESRQVYDPDIVKFTQLIRTEIFDRLLQLRKKYPKSKALVALLAEIQKADHVRHLSRYIEEVKMFQDILYKVEHDDPSWT